MNFEIQKRALSRVIRDDLDALIVLWPSQGPQGDAATDPLSHLVLQAVQKGDFEDKAGTLLNLYGHAGLKARTTVVVHAADNQASQIRTAVRAAWSAVKSSKVKKLGLHMPG